MQHCQYILFFFIFSKAIFFSFLHANKCDKLDECSLLFFSFLSLDMSFWKVVIVHAKATYIKIESLMFLCFSLCYTLFALLT